MYEVFGRDSLPVQVLPIKVIPAASNFLEATILVKAMPLAVAGAFHTTIMRPADERLAAALADVEIRKPKIPVVSNVDAQAHDDPEEIRQLLIRQVVQPVLWEDSMRKLMADGFDQFHEVGPGRVLRGLLRRIDRKISCQCVPV
jgi:[acyl-carrier-protein] S-malonyltransferase